MKFDARTDRVLIRAAGDSRRYVMVSFTAPVAPPKAGRYPINVAFVLDRSGSMSPERKIELVQEAADKAIGMLREDDRFSVVIYDDKIDVLMESTCASGEAKRAVRQQLERITARGSTNLSGGWLTGCEQAALHINSDVPAKCLLLTDGLANQGIVSTDDLTRHASELRQRGVLTSTFGVGRDFDERLLQNMAEAGGGHSYFIEKAVQIPDFLTSELGETLEIVARDVALQFSLPAGVDAEPLNRFRHGRVGDTLRLELGNLVSGQEMRVVTALRFPAGGIGDVLSAGVRLTDRDGAFDTAPIAMNWTFADHKDNDVQVRDRVVDAAVAELYAAKARDEAVEYNRRGEFSRAKAVMTRTAERIIGYAGNDPVLNQLAANMVQEAGEYEEHMDAMALKERSYESHHMLRNRDPQGKSRRSS